METSHTGRLLVASPLLGDPNFRRTVVLLLEHGQEGALGLVLNRPSDVVVSSLAPEWSGVTARPGVLFVGGPVQQEAVLALGLANAAGVEGFIPVVGRLGLARGGEGAPGTQGLEEARLFAGYAGWGAGQLEEEISQQAWFVIDADPGDALSLAPETLWSRVLRRQRGMLALFSTYPEDPELN